MKISLTVILKVGIKIGLYVGLKVILKKVSSISETLNLKQIKEKS